MIGGTLMLDIGGTELTSADRDLLLRGEVGGLIFFSRNFVSREQFLSLTASVRALRPDLVLAIDQEGGRVQRLRDGYTALPAMQCLGDVYCRDQTKGAHLLHEVGWLMAAEVIASGLDMSFAPVLDIDRSHCAVISDRAFGDEATLVSQAARHFINGMHEAGMAATGKHFPGHGGVTADSHLQTPSDNRELASLRDRDLAPFVTLASQLEAIMPAHIVFPNIDIQAVGFSQFWLQNILRTDLAFNGLIFSDDLSMKGADVAGSYRQKAEAALLAGCDVILVCNNRPGALEVMDFLSSYNLPRRCKPIAAMKARCDWQWAALNNSSRRDALVEELGELLAR